MDSWAFYFQGMMEPYLQQLYHNFWQLGSQLWVGGKTMLLGDLHLHQVCGIAPQHDADARKGHTLGNQAAIETLAGWQLAACLLEDRHRYLTT